MKVAKSSTSLGAANETRAASVRRAQVVSAFGLLEAAVQGCFDRRVNASGERCTRSRAIECLRLLQATRKVIYVLWGRGPVRHPAHFGQRFVKNEEEEFLLNALYRGSVECCEYRIAANRARDANAVDLPYPLVKTSSHRVGVRGIARPEIAGQ